MRMGILYIYTLIRPSQWIEATSPEYVSEGTDDYDEADGSDDDDGNVPVRVETLRVKYPSRNKNQSTTLLCQ